MTTLIFHRASAMTTIPITTSVTVAARRAVVLIARDRARSVEAFNPMLASAEEQVYLDARRHGVVLARPLARAGAVAALGAAGFALGWPFSLGGAALLLVAAGLAVAAVWRWDRTRVVVTREKLVVEHGIVRRRAAAVRLARVSTVELEQSLLGRVLGYGTVVAGDLEIAFVARPRELLAELDRR